MASKSKNNKKAPKVSINNELLKQIRHLETDLKFTVRAIDGKSEQLDELFKNQAERIKTKINNLKGIQ